MPSPDVPGPYGKADGHGNGWRFLLYLRFQKLFDILGFDFHIMLVDRGGKAHFL